MVVTCDIEFDNNVHGTYFAGQMVAGRITLKSDKVKKVRGVALKIKGFAHTSWSESYTTTVSDGRGGTTTQTHTVTYTGHEDYIATLTYVLGSDSHGQTVNIEPGTHTFNFSCHLPPICPSSFEGTHGHVRYTVKVALIRPWKFDQTFMRGFTVLKLMDLNYGSPTLRIPNSTEIRKTFGFFPFKSKPVHLSLNLPQSGYVPGQNIPACLLVTNDSHILIKEIKAKLVMLVCYYSEYGQSKNERIVITKVKGEEQVPRNCKKLLNFALNVPATPPTCLTLCRFIKIAYQVELVAKVQGLHSDQVICMPVTIGNVPLQDLLTPQSGVERGLLESAPLDGTNKIDETEVGATTKTKTADGVDDNKDAQKCAEANVVASASNPCAVDSSLPPPSYEEAVHMPHAKINKDEEHDYGQGDFTPRYPVFQIPSPTAPTADDIEGAAANIKN